MSKTKKDCAFQYYNGSKMVVDITTITLGEAKRLWNENYADMVEQVKNLRDIEVAIWINMKNPINYHETLVHLSSPSESNGILWEKKFYNKQLS